MTWVFEIYNTTTDLGAYTEYVTGNCLEGGSDVVWDPSDPAVDYGDPNLP